MLVGYACGHARTSVNSPRVLGPPRIMVGAESVLRPHAIGSLAALLPLLGPHAIVRAEFLPVVVWAADLADRLR